MSTWIRAKEIPEKYKIGKTKSYTLLREFKAQTDTKNYIKDGKVLIVRQDQFEEWWENRGRKNG